METWQDRYRRFVKAQGWTFPALHQETHIPLENLKKYNQNKPIAQPRGNTLPTLARAFHTTLRFLRDGESDTDINIPKVGYVGAGEVFIPLDSVDADNAPETLSFLLGVSDPICVEVKGSSMAPVYRSGDCLICSRHSAKTVDQFLNMDCVVRLETGEGYIKKVVKGTRPNRFTLVSYAAEPISDVALAWAAPVKWIKRA